MNKYLLLRDNKQSGPYTVPEIIDIGIKPYDLVWVDGKSAAWRYPSEIEELKTYAPAVEEQPFDRFYKTREAILNNQPQVVKVAEITAPSAFEHSPYEPKIVEVVTPEEEIVPRKKVYINFPVNSKPEVKAPQPQPQPAPVKQIFPVKEVPASTFSEYNIDNNSSFTRSAERLPAKNSEKRSEKKMVAIAAVAACVILLGLIAFLMINNSGQKQRLKELNTIVKDIQNKNNTAGLVVTQVKNTEPVPQPGPTSETIINPELLKLSETEAPAQHETKIVVPPVPVPAKQTAETPLFKENTEAGGRPVTRRSDNNTASKPEANENSSIADAPPADNLFKHVSIQPGKYKVGMLGGVSNLTLALTNNSKRELHKVVVLISYLGPEKKIVNTQTVYFENVAPGEQSTIEVPRSKRGVSIDYTITDIKS